MDFKLLAIFIVLNVANVIIQTVKSIATVKCGKTIAAIINAVAYGLYTFVVIYMTIDGLNIWTKAGIIAAANFGGVFIVKLIEEKMRKDKLWLVKMTIPSDNNENAQHLLKQADIPFNYVDISKYFIFDTYCESKKDTDTALKICEICGGKAFATENKLSL